MFQVNRGISIEMERRIKNVINSLNSINSNYIKSHYASKLNLSHNFSRRFPKEDVHAKFKPGFGPAV